MDLREAKNLIRKLSETQKRIIRAWDETRTYSFEFQGSVSIPMVVGGETVKRPTRNKLESFGLITIESKQDGFLWGVRTYKISDLGMKVKNLLTNS